MSRIHAANREILDSLRGQREREHLRRRTLTPLHVIDEMLADLEELHLVSRKRVPETWDSRLAALTAMLPVGVGAAELRSRITIVHLMDQLYDIQHVLLRIKTGGRGDLADEDLDRAS